MIEQALDFKFIINFEYVAEFIFFAMFIYMFVQKKYLLKRSRTFMIVIGLSIVNTACDIYASTLLNRINDAATASKYLATANILSTTYFLLLFMSIFAFSIYIVLITCGFDYIHKKKIKTIGYYVPALLITFIIFSNYFMPSLITYEFNSNLSMKINVYSTLLFAALMSIYLIHTIILMFRYKTIFEKKQLAAITLIFPIMLLGMIGEMMVPKTLILSFMISLFVILVHTVLESSEDMVDSNTNLPNIDEFYKAIKKAFFTKDEKKTVVLMRIANYSYLTATYSTSVVRKYINNITEYTLKFRKQNKIKDDLYSLNDGYFASICNKADFIDVSPSDFYDEELQKRYCPLYFPKFEYCYFEPYNDFENVDEAINFISNYREVLKFDNDYVKYSDVKNDQNLIIQNHLEQIIDTALEEHEFYVYYQPIYSIKEKKVKTAEALVRFISKKDGFISPMEFIPYAENNGRIAEIDGFVMEEVFKFVSSPQFDELGLDYIEINLSMAECTNGVLIERIRRLKEKYNIDPKKINLEITESYDPTEQVEINRNLDKIVELGMKRSRDDYGTGY